MRSRSLSIHRMCKRVRREHICCIAIGGINIVHSTVFPWLLSHQLHYDDAYVLGVSMTLVLSYFLNARFTFHASPSGKGLLLFILAHLPKYVLQMLVVVALVEYAQMTAFHAFILSGTAGILLTGGLKRQLGFTIDANEKHKRDTKSIRTFEGRRKALPHPDDNNV